VYRSVLATSGRGSLPAVRKQSHVGETRMLLAPGRNEGAVTKAIDIELLPGMDLHL
jgi:hypothetical protein